MSRFKKRPSTSVKTAKSLYFKGKYKEAASLGSTISGLCYKLGGLVFIAKHHEARSLYQEYIDTLPQEDKIIAKFHIAISYIRTSNYTKGKKLLDENFDELDESKFTPETIFFIYQGLSFYYYFFSKYSLSFKYSELSFSASVKTKKEFQLLKALALDIQGHNLVQLGKIHLGLKRLKEGFQICENFNFKNLGFSIKNSIVLYECEHESDFDKNILVLKKALSETPRSNDYSCSEIVLQIANLLLIKGCYQMAQDYLSENYEIIYENENKRKVAKLNIVLSTIMIFRGQYMEALALLTVAQNNLDKRVDSSLLMPIMGLRISILQRLGKDYSAIQKDKDKMLKKTDSYLSKRIESRKNKGSIKYNVGDDLLGDIFDSIEKLEGNEKLVKIIKSNILSLLPLELKLLTNKKYIIYHSHLNIVIIKDLNGLVKLDEGLSPLQIKILNYLSGGTKSKQEIIEVIWGYEYDSLRHDSLIYTNIKRLRSLFGENDHLIINNENSYGLESDIVFLEISVSKKVVVIKSKNDNVISDRSGNDERIELGNSLAEFSLNHRQTIFLRDIRNEYTDVATYSKSWGVTKKTALRDLKRLEEINLIERKGNARATKYFKK